MQVTPALGTIPKAALLWPAAGCLTARHLATLAALWLAALLTWAPRAEAQQAAAAQDEAELGELLITGEQGERLTPLAILPSLSPDYEDVVVRGVVRRDFELTGMFKVIPDSRAPSGLYGFNDPVDIRAWSRVGAEVIVKLAARRERGQIRIFGLCYFLSHGRKPVYEKTLLVAPEDVRMTAHRIADALLGAITGRNGGFSSHLTFSSRVGRNPAAYTVDADGHNIQSRTDPDHTTIAPNFGPGGALFFPQSRNYGPFRLFQKAAAGGPAARVPVPFRRSVYSATFSPDHRRLAVSVATPEGSSIFVGDADGRVMVRASKTAVATHPVFSPSGKLAWVGGNADRGTQRVYVEGRPVSPRAFSAAAPTFCDTEDGVRLVFAVSVGSGQDLVMSDERGKELVRLTQYEGSNSYPACSPDGRLLAYFSERKRDRGLFIKSLKNGKTQKISGKLGQSLRWAPLPSP